MKLKQWEIIFSEHLVINDKNEKALADYYQLSHEDKANLIAINQHIKSFFDTSEYKDNSLTSFLLGMDKKRIELANLVLKNFTELSHLKIINDEKTGQLKIGLLAEIKPEYFPDIQKSVTKNTKKPF